MITDLSECYRILDLAPGATQEEVKRSYRELVKVWHPDRFANDPELQKKAQEKLKLINLAYERICTGDAGEPRRRSSHAGTSASQAGEQTRPAGNGGSTNNQSEPKTEAPRQPPPPPLASKPVPATNLGRRIVQFAATVFIILLIRAVFHADNQSRSKTAAYSPYYGQESQGYSTPTPAVTHSQPKARQHLRIEEILGFHREALIRWPDLPISVQEFSRYMQANQSDYDFSEGLAYSPPPIAPQPEALPARVATTPLLEQPVLHDKPVSAGGATVAPSTSTTESPRKVEVPLAKTRDSASSTPSISERNFFTVGSAKQDVLSIQGTPDRFTDTSFAYGTSDVFFENGRVKSWDNRFPKLKAMLLPATQAGKTGYFTAGSTKDEVLAVQGTPDRFTDTSFAYGTSDVFFEKGRVKSWDNRFPKLKVQLLPATPTATKGHFTVDSTKDEVLAIQGTPDRFTDTSFAYGTSDVFFQNGRVKSWDNRFPKLNAELLPGVQAESRGYFTVGSTKDEVLAVQGTPDRFTDATFSYGTSDVFFEKSRVKSWDDRYPKLKVRLLTEPQTSKRP